MKFKEGDSMTKWEYKNLQAPEKYSDIHGTYLEYIMEEDLDALGAEGWEVVTAKYTWSYEIVCALLKRQVPHHSEAPC